ncbi:hypothetical protein OXX80_008933 [Metschnikowia pulcherrima]
MGIFLKGSKNGAASGHRINLDVPNSVGSVLASAPHDSRSELHPLASPAHEEVPIWNILPSYQLYESTFAKSMNPSVENFEGEPPVYEDSPPNPESPGASTDYFGRQANPSNTGSAFRTPEPRWENSILAHSHRMKHVDEFNKSIADKLKIDIVLTKKPGQKGRVPDMYNPLEMEFSQGDSIHGHVVVMNTCTEPLSFDMFSVVFEGRISVNNNDATSGTRPLLFYKFLNMFDYNASWTPVFFEDYSPENPDCIDPVDGTTLQFPFERHLMPGVAYKKFFSFTIPAKLLDCACEIHEIPHHCLLFPSIGLDKNVFLQRMRKLRETPLKSERTPFATTSSSKKQGLSSSNPAPKKKAPNLITRDYGFPDTSISYSVETKVIGKRSVYEKPGKPHNEEFIVVKEASLPLRVVPRDIGMGEQDDDYIAERHYDSFLKNVKKCIDLGQRLESGEDKTTLTRKLSVAKQTYNAAAQPTKDAIREGVYEVHLPYRKKHLTQSAKVVGLLKASFSRLEHTVQYEVPYVFAPVLSHATEKPTKLRVEIHLEYSSIERDARGIHPPEIRGISARIAICTVRSKKYPIPIELTQEMKFRNILGSSDCVEKYVVSPFKTYLEEMKKLIGMYGMSVLGISQQLLMDVKSLANLDSKTAMLKVDTIAVNTEGGLHHWKETHGQKKAEKKVEIEVDIQSLFIKDAKRPTEDKLMGALTLVPSFQSCIMCRYYYSLIEIKLGNGETMPIKIPFKISK